MKTRHLVVLSVLYAAICFGAGGKAEYMSAATHLANGEQFINQGAFSDAIGELRAGISELGESYFDSSVLDDTDQALGLAKIVERQGKLSQAAALYRGVLSSRLSIYEHKAEGSAAQPALQADSPADPAHDRP